MLARHAENMFWAGRNMERADDTARMLDVSFHTAVQHNPDDAAADSRRLLQVLRLDSIYDEFHDSIDPDQVASFLISHPQNPGSVVACVSAGRENLRTTRELVSTELWEAANRAHLDLRRRTSTKGDALSPYQVIGAVRDHCQTLMGVATQTMPRDDAWNFFNLGYMLERAAMTLRLVAARESTAPETFEGWITALRSTSSLEAFQRAARGSTSAGDVAGFLLFNQTHPRSVLYCMTRSEEYLELLGGTDPRRRAAACSVGCAPSSTSAISTRSSMPA